MGGKTPQSGGEHRDEKRPPSKDGLNQGTTITYRHSLKRTLDEHSMDTLSEGATNNIKRIDSFTIR